MKVSAESKAWLTKWRSHSDVERIFSPANWGYTARNPSKAYYAECPTLQKYDEFYGDGNSDFWVYSQIMALFGASSSKDVGVVDGIKIFAQSFASQVKVYKLSELMLFFARYKAGRYDNSFSQFDARRIGNAFFKEFLPERNREIAKCETRKTSEDTLSRVALPPGYLPEGYTSLTWYQETKRLAKLGNLEAIERLKPPMK